MALASSCHADVAHALLRAGSRLCLMSKNSAELVAQADSLRATVAWPLAALASWQVGRLTIGRRLSACATSSCSFHIASELPGDASDTMASMRRREFHERAAALAASQAAPDSGAQAP